MRPLDRLRSIKVKLGVLIVATVLLTVVVLVLGFKLGLPVWARVVIASLLGLVAVQVLAHGMTAPLREMVAAAGAMRRGDLGRRVRATSHDEVGELARAFNAMAAELADVDRQRRDLVANASHELRTPLAALRALLENLTDGVQPPDPAALATALAQTERLGRLVDGLLDLSRVEGGGPVTPAPFDVFGLLEGAAREARLAGRGDVRIDVTVQPGGLEGWGDAAGLRHVVANLLDNAVRHSPAGGRVQACGWREPGGLRFAVADEGPGIPAAEAARVFERFYRTDAARSAHEGAGLGLAIARSVVDAHGGAIEVQPRVPHGCRVVVALPGPGA